MEDLFKELEQLVDKTAKKLNDGVNQVAAKVSEEKNKIDLKSQIGHHERTVRKNYARLGEAYYNLVVNGTAIENQDDLIEMIKTNQKVISLLEDQLNQFVKVEVKEEVKEEVKAEEVDSEE